ncbi:beta-N-acetylhexosaminidase [Candidatus Latescibacterota bacterium]
MKTGVFPTLIRINILRFIFCIFIVSHFSCMLDNSEKSLTIPDISIIPAPSKLNRHDGFFEITPKTVILTDIGNGEVNAVGGYLAEMIEHAAGFTLQVKDRVDNIPNGAIVLTMDNASGITNPEGYQLTVAKDTAMVTAQTPAGLFYGIQTIRQLLPLVIDDINGAKDKIRLIMPCVTIEDTPRFSWRGMHLDVSRHLFPKQFIMKFIDIMALHKMNTFHWHLVDGAGWRIEIDRYPRLTEFGAWRVDTTGKRWDFTKILAPEVGDTRKPYGGFYTKDDISEIVRYAEERFITIVPEIEMPGHANAALASYPRYLCVNAEETNREYRNSGVFCAGKEDTFTFLENILDEVFELFPGTYLHIGGDEVAKRHWKVCPDCQKRIRNEGLADENELQSYFIKRMEKYLKLHNRKLIGWDEILEGGLAEDATVMSWRGMKGGVEAASHRHDVIMTPEAMCYFNHYQGNPELEPIAWGGFTPLNQVYAFDPVSDELTPEEGAYVLGAQGCVWSEFIDTPELAEYMILPRLSALAEVVWSSRDNRD